MRDIIDRIKLDNAGEIFPPSGRPRTSDFALPPDIVDFYDLCGGVKLFSGKEASLSIVPPESFVRSNPLIVGDPGTDDISFHWFTIAETTDQFVTIDLHPRRAGRCYDSFWDRHGVAGSCKIIARTFREFLLLTLETRGEYLYWTDPSFGGFGDAYDDQ